MANPILSNGQASPQSFYEQFKVTLAGGNQNRAEGHHPVGTRGFLDDGRVFYYSSNSTTELQVGSLLVLPVTIGLNIIASDDKITLTSSIAGAPWGVGDTRVALYEADVDTADIITNSYKDGFCYIEDGTGQGYYYKIKGHSQFDTSGTATSGYIDLFDGIKVAPAAAAKFSLAKNPNDRVITSTTAPEETPVGVAPIIVSASTALATDVTTTAASTDTYFFWAQTWGPAMVEVDSTGVASGIALAGAATVDQVGPMTMTVGTAATPVAGDTYPEVGWGLVTKAAAQADYALVELRIKP